MSGRLVLDKTNLTGDYDIVLDYAMEGETPDLGSAIMDAVQEELGLKLLWHRHCDVAVFHSAGVIALQIERAGLGFV
jgi:uncharacterized protein (TIGR03435 family)